MTYLLILNDFIPDANVFTRLNIKSIDRKTSLDLHSIKISLHSPFWGRRDSFWEVS